MKAGQTGRAYHRETVMITPQRVSKYLLLTVAMLAVSLTASAYEVRVLTGNGSESKALDNGDYDLAIKRLELRTKNDSRTIDIQLTNLCTAYVVTSQFDKARLTCDRAVEAKGDFVGTAYNSRGVLNALTGDYIAALNDFEMAADQANYPLPRRQAGDLMPSLRRYSTPAVDVKQSIELAAMNLQFADRRWATLKEESQDLSAGIR
jgi:tetratricopeptide (TPR) repeat protein